MRTALSFIFLCFSMVAIAQNGLFEYEKAMDYDKQKDYDKEFEYLQKSANLGHPDAQNRLAAFFYLGVGTKQNLPKALYWYEKAAGQNQKEAQYSLGEFYEDGTVVRKNQQKALYWYSKSAYQLYNRGIVSYVNLFIKLSGYKKNEKLDEILNCLKNDYISAAFQTINKLGQEKDEVTECILGILYEETDMTDKAYLCYQKSASSGFPLAMALLGHSYEKGLGTGINFNEAFSWYQKALNKGFPCDELASSINSFSQGNSEKDLVEVSDDNKSKDDVDINIPLTTTKNKNTYVVIIANEEYLEELPVQYALNDGGIFKEYCHKTLGIPDDNIHYVPNATLNMMRKHIKWLKDVMQNKTDAQVIFYYAGHGIPNEADGTAFLLPVDGFGSDYSSGYSTEDLYKQLDEIHAKSVLVFLDACFSGAKRDGGMLSSARGVAIKVKKDKPKGNMAVFTAASGDETAYPYKEMKHGMFTYFLLQKLKESKGKANLGEIVDYVITNVARRSIVNNGKRQTPTLSSSSSDWSSWRLN